MDDSLVTITSDNRDAIAEISMSYNSLVRLGRCEAMVLYPRSARSFSAPHADCTSNRSAVIVINWIIYSTHREQSKQPSLHTHLKGTGMHI